MQHKNIFKDEKKPRAVLVALCEKSRDEEETYVSLEELKRLLETAGGEFFASLVQAREAPDARTYIGRGKVKELSELCRDNDISLVVFDTELSPAQIRNLEEDMDFPRVIDRSMLILDIFALHAGSGEGKLQVELAQLKYTIPRLIGKGSELSRLGGGIGTRGPGESKLESDRRHVKRRIAALEAELAELEKNRRTQRGQRERSGLFKIAIAGYTNAGKSTLLNRLTDAGILAEDKLFATLDPTTRKYVLPAGTEILLTDTVGFIRNLPHHLIRAFRSTLDEVRFCDAVMLVADASDPECASQLAVAESLVRELNDDGEKGEATPKPVLYVFNKMDAAGADFILPQTQLSGPYVTISAKTGQGIDALCAMMEQAAGSGKSTETYLIPPADGGAVNYLYKNATVLSCEYEAEGVRVTAVADARVRGMYRKYKVD